MIPLYDADLLLSQRNENPQFALYTLCGLTSSGASAAMCYAPVNMISI